MTEKGEIFPLVIIATMVVLMSTLVTITGSQLYFQNASYAADAEKATNLAEAGIDKALQSLNKTGGSYSGETETFLGDGSYAVKITTKDAITKIIESTGYLPDKNKAKVKRTVKIESSKGLGASFVYGVQVGDGGLQLDHGNTVVGSVYSNGSVTSNQNNSITGDVWVAGGPQATSDQETDCQGANCTDFIFGKNISGEDRLDTAQSFKPSAANTLNRISIKIKKISNPADVTVRILGDKEGQPDKNNVLATGTLFAALISQSYSFIDVTFSSTPQLSADTTYWMMLDTSSDFSNYWSWQNDLAGSYTRGLPKWSPNWNIGNPSWSSFAGDLSFKIIMGGAITSISSTHNLAVGGNAHANTIQNLTIQKDAYYKTISGSTVNGQSFPDSADPPPKVFPISDANINDWKNQAQNSGVTNSDITSCPSVLGPGKIAGNVSLQNRCVINVKSPVWITGNFIMNNDNILRLDSSFGPTSGVIMIDGQVDFKDNNKVEGSGVGSSILMVLSNFDSRTNNIPAIAIKNNGNTGVFYANVGIIEPGNNNQFKELTAWGIRLVANSTLTYETGLSSTLFSTGPSGSYSLVKGTYQVK